MATIAQKGEKHNIKEMTLDRSVSLHSLDQGSFLFTLDI